MPKEAPLARFLRAHGIRRVEVAAAAGTNLKTVDRICRGDVDGMKIRTICRVATAVGVPASKLVPKLLGSARQRYGD